MRGCHGDPGSPDGCPDGHALALLATTARTAEIVVTTEDDVVASDGQVSLREAILTAETDSSVDGSARGHGADVIHFADGVEKIGLSLVDDETVGKSAFRIDTDVTIEGDATKGIFLFLDSGETRFAYVSETGSLTLRYATVHGFTTVGGAGEGGSLPGASGGGGAGSAATEGDVPGGAGGLGGFGGGSGGLGLGAGTPTRPGGDGADGGAAVYHLNDGELRPLELTKCVLSGPDPSAELEVAALDGLPAPTLAGGGFNWIESAAGFTPAIPTQGPAELVRFAVDGQGPVATFPPTAGSGLIDAGTAA